jgi:hypothetical protein
MRLCRRSTARPPRRLRRINDYLAGGALQRSPVSYCCDESSAPRDRAGQGEHCKFTRCLWVEAEWNSGGILSPKRG